MPRKGSLPALLHQLVGVILDHGVGEKLSAYPLYLLASPALVGFGQIDLDILSLPDVVHAGEADARQRLLNRLALRVEDTGLERDPDARLHAVGFNSAWS